MVRLSLQQSDKDDFFSIVCTLDIDLNDATREIADNASQTSQTVEVGSVASTVRSDRLDADGPHSAMESSNVPPPTNLLSMLGCVLADPTIDVSEKGTALEIISGIVMHDPDLIRRHSVDFYITRKKLVDSKSGKAVSTRPKPNEKEQVLLLYPGSDLLAALLALLSVATDAGILLTVSEILRIVLDTDMLSDHGPFADESEGLPLGSSTQLQPHEQQRNSLQGIGASNDQKQFLDVFYEHYMEWLVAPFQSSILYPVRRVPEHLLLDTSESPLLQKIHSSFQKGIPKDDPLVKTVAPCAIRASFAVELLSFCIRAHMHRMKFFLIRSRVMDNVLKFLRPSYGRGMSGDRCLKLATLRFLRATLSVNDERYHRHIIQRDLFAPVFEALRSNPVGDNLVSSAIVEMCDYIHSEKIRSLIEYIVTKYLSANPQENAPAPRLEDVSSPYVSTLTVLRKTYESGSASRGEDYDDDLDGTATTPNSSRYFEAGTGAVAAALATGAHRSHLLQSSSQPNATGVGGGGIGGVPPRRLTGRALEDQRKFREADHDESYFELSDEDEDTASSSSIDSGVVASGDIPSSVPSVVDEISQHRVSNDQPPELHSSEGESVGSAIASSDVLHRTPRMFSLAQTSLLGTPSNEDLPGSTLL
jgi:protein phosphatase-4 regulatory subunit 3